MPSTKRSRYAAPPVSTTSNSERALRITALLGLVAIFALSGLQLQRGDTSTTGITPTAANGSPTALIFPTVAAGGAVLVRDYTYFHPSAVFSAPHLLGWDLPTGGEERTDPAQGAGISRVGATFINGNALSVVHIFAESDPKRTAKTVQDLGAFYDKVNLDAAWQNFTGGYKETKRHIEGDQYIIDFELYLNGSTYLGRQVSRFSDAWLVVARLVTPINNPKLMDDLQAQVWGGVVLYTNEANTPLSWSSVADPAVGYVIKYPAAWNKLSGAFGLPYIVTGPLGSMTITMTTQGEPGKAARTDPDARAWITARNPKAVVQTVKPFSSGDASGYVVSYNDPDADGNPRSSVATLLNGTNGTLYSAIMLSTTRGIDLLNDADKTIPPELGQMRSSFMTLNTARMIPTLTPTNTLTPTITPTNTATLPVTPSTATPAATITPTLIATPQAPAVPTSASAF